MGKEKEMKPWLGQYPVVSEDHHADLDARAAILELRGKLPRDQAERQAHQDYLKDQAYRASAHHLLGIRASIASGNDAAATRHGQSYATAMRAAGHGPLESPPQQVLDYIKDAKNKVFSFKEHESDGIFSPVTLPKASSSDEILAQKLETLKGLKDKLK